MHIFRRKIQSHSQSWKKQILFREFLKNIIEKHNINSSGKLGSCMENTDAPKLCQCKLQFLICYLFFSVLRVDLVKHF